MNFHRHSSRPFGTEGSYPYHFARFRDTAAKSCSPHFNRVEIRIQRPESFRVPRRVELQLAILIETMRRAVFELMRKPRIVGRKPKTAPAGAGWRLLIDVPRTLGTTLELICSRRGECSKMAIKSEQRCAYISRFLARTNWPAQPVAHRYARHRADSLDL